MTTSRYANWQDVVNRYRDVAKDYDDNDTSVSFIQGAEAEIDSALGVRYAVPFTTVPAVVKDLTIDLTYYKMRFREEKWPQEFYKNILARLKALVDGDAVLVDDAGVVVAPLSQQVGPWTDRPGAPTFGPEDIIDSSISETWLTEREGSKA